MELKTWTGSNQAAKAKGKYNHLKTCENCGLMYQGDMSMVKCVACGGKVDIARINMGVFIPAKE